MTADPIRTFTATTVAVGLLATPVLWTPLAFANGESRGAVLATWLVVPVLPIVGAWVARSRPDNPVGWLLVTIGLAQTFGMLQGQAATHAVTHGWSDTAVGWLLWTGGVLWVLGLPLFPIVLVLFPDGRPPTARWRPALWLAVAGPVLLLLAGLAPGPLPGEDVSIDNPAGVPGLDFLADVGRIGLLLVVVGVVVATASLVVRWRRSTGIERLQLRWVAFAVCITAVVVLAGLPTPAGSALELLGLLLLLGGIPASIGVAVVRYHLYDLPVVINRTLVYGLATLVLLTTYATLTALTLRLLEWHDTTSALTATAVVAMLFSPVRDRSQQLVNRRLFGSRNDPYDALLQLGRDLETYLPADEVLQMLADRVRHALQVPYAAIELDDAPSGTQHAAGTATDVIVAVALRHRGEVVGHLVVSPRPPDGDLPTADRRVLEAMAGQAGAAVQAARLQAHVQASTARRVAAVEEERRRIRRDLHDGLGPALAGVGLGLENAIRRVDAGGDGASAELLARLRGEIDDAIGSVRGLVYGLRPPALDELGLEGALRTAVAAAAGPMRVELQVTGLASGDRLPAAVEVAAFRIAMEAVANATRHGGARRCTVDITANGALTVTVSDDGAGLPEGWRAGVGIISMRERAGELGGTLTLLPRDGGGVQVLATLPVAASDAAGAS